MHERQKLDDTLKSAWLLYAGAALSATLALSACAQGDVDTDETGAGGQTSSSSVGGGGAGGMEELPCGIDCATIDAPLCNVAVCNEESGQCEVVSAENGTTCDDELFCSINDQCISGMCVGAQNDCGMMTDTCASVVCDEGTKSCSTEPASDGAICSSDDPCMVNTMCSNGVCTGVVNNCAFTVLPGPCWAATCQSANGGTCEVAPAFANQGCTDPDELCTEGKMCDDAGNCLGGTPKDCTNFGFECNDGVCDPTSGNCTTEPVPEGGSCPGAADECNLGECDANGQCQPAPSNIGGSCESAADFCNAGMCDASGVCTGAVTNEGGVCDDGDTCTGGETCTAGACGGGATVPQVVYFEEDFADNAAGWTTDTEWAIGAAMSSGMTVSCGSGDPGMDASASAANGVAGVVLGGDADVSATHGYYWLTSPVIDTSTAPAQLSLGYQRFLNSDTPNFMVNRVEVYDGTEWKVVWESTGPIGDTDWTPISHDLTPYRNSAMQLRFGFEVGQTGAYVCSGWNLDDVVVANVICPN